MKKAILLTLFCSLLFVLGFSQNEEYKHVGSASAGISFTGIALNLVDAAILDNSSFKVENTPALQLTYDYGIKKFFSLGVAVDYQKFNIDAENFTYKNIDGIEQTGSFGADFSRLNMVLRPLFHYANNDDLDLYSGFRIGFTNNKFNAKSTIDNSIIEDFGIDDLGIDFLNILPLKNITTPSFAFTAFGLRYYVTDNIGAGFEINIGAPYITALNINARF